MTFILPEIIQSGRYLLFKKRPYLSSAVLSLIPVQRDDKDGLETMAVDKWGRWYINVDQVTKWPVGKIALCIIHELGHLLRGHFERLTAYENYYTSLGVSLANVAGDLEINDDLDLDVKDLNIQKPDDWLYPRVFKLDDCLFAEEYAEKLLKQSSTKVGGGGQNSTQNIGKGNCGSCSGSGQKAWEEGPPAGVGSGDGKNSISASKVPGMTKAEVDMLRRHTAEQIKEHCKNRGTVPGSWQRWADAELEPPKIPWTREFAAVLKRMQADKLGMVNYSWKKPSKRSTDRVLLPSLRRPNVEAVAVIDTSGSMSEADLSRSLREFAGVLKAVGMEGMRVIAVDAAAQVSKKVWKASQVELIGGGGTDMRVGIDAALACKPRPDFIVVFTDGYTPWPDAPPPYGVKILAVLVEDCRDLPPAWIRTLKALD